MLTIANPQILMSAPPRRNFRKFQGSGFASPRSLSTRSMINFASRSFRKCQEVWALSGKSTRAQYAMMPRKQVREPSMMKIHLQLFTTLAFYHHQRSPDTNDHKQGKVITTAARPQAKKEDLRKSSPRIKHEKYAPIQSLTSLELHQSIG
jgi:hypothetical protein